MRKLLLFFLFLTAAEVMACPYCAGASDASDKNTWWILAVFIALTYIPFYLLFKKAFKKRNKEAEKQ